jgi:hypothetical protein
VLGGINTTAGTITTLDALDTAQDTQHATTQTAIADVPTVAEFEARTLAAADYFDPAADTVANVTTVGSVTTTTGYKLASDGLDLVVPADPGTTIPVLGTSSLVVWQGYFAAWSVNKVESNETDNEVRLRNTADNDNLAQHAIADDGNEFSSGAAS